MQSPFCGIEAPSAAKIKILPQSASQYDTKDCFKLELNEGRFPVAAGADIDSVEGYSAGFNCCIEIKNDIGANIRVNVVFV